MPSIDNEMRKQATDILVFFYPTNPPQSMNENLADLAARMLHEALKASNALDLVPRPTGMRPGLSWLAKQAVKMFWRSAGKQKIYEIARKAVAYKFSGEYRIAKIGI